MPRTRAKTVRKTIQISESSYISLKALQLALDHELSLGKIVERLLLRFHNVFLEDYVTSWTYSKISFDREEIISNQNSHEGLRSKPQPLQKEVFEAASAPSQSSFLETLSYMETEIGNKLSRPKEA